MHDDALTALEHLRKSTAVKPDRCQQVEVQLGKPVLVRQGHKAACR